LNTLDLIGRKKPLFEKDILNKGFQIKQIIESSTFLVIGGAGSIGQAVTKEIFKRNPLKLHVVDISENNIVELVRDIRSAYGYIDGDFRTFSLDIGSIEYDSFIKNDGKYEPKSAYDFQRGRSSKNRRSHEPNASCE
jgi:FlaA1/EpsC-like NDP-sugar epimerase